MTGELWDLRAVVEGFSRSRAISSEAQENEESAKPISIQLETKKPSSPAPKSAKKRKSPPKKVDCELPADALSDCVWAWRKYGQKPIKDSPYPRGYYRCSSSKGCPARKQVERSRTKAGYFVVVYTGEHNHAAPVHRQRSPPQFSARDAGDGGGSAATSPPTPSAGEPNIPPPAVEEVEREKGEMDKLSDDDFIFMDLDLLIDSDADGFFADDLFGGSGDAWPQRIAGS